MGHFLIFIIERAIARRNPELARRIHKAKLQILMSLFIAFVAGLFLVYGISSSRQTYGGINAAAPTLDPDLAFTLGSTNAIQLSNVAVSPIDLQGSNK
jgi:hypothetical protein